jgi:hypothetical protein
MFGGKSRKDSSLDSDGGGDGGMFGGRTRKDSNLDSDGVGGGMFGGGTRKVAALFLPPTPSSTAITFHHCNLTDF